MEKVSFWLKTLKTIPEVSKNEWNALGIISKWLVATRSAVFIMTAISCIIGGLLAYHYTGEFNFVNFLVCFIGLIFAHGANNMMNDLIDFNKGIDNNNYYRALYGPQLIENGYSNKKQFYKFIAFTLAVAIVSGAFLVLRTDLTTLWIMLGGLLLLVFYTWPLKYIGMGEPAVMVVWGPLMIGGTFYVSSNGIWNWDIISIGLLYAMGPTTVLFGKHIDKSDKDKLKKVFTLPVLLGEKLSRYTTIGIWISQYIIIGYLIWQGSLSYAFLITLLALPKLFNTAKFFLKPKPTEKPEGEIQTTCPLFFASYAFVYNKLFSQLFLLGLIAQVLIKIFL